MKSHKLASKSFNIINKISATKVQWVEVQYILSNAEESLAFIEKMELKPHADEFAKCEVVLGVEKKVGGGLNS